MTSAIEASVPGTVCPADGRTLEPVTATPVGEVKDVIARARAAQAGWASQPLAARAKAVKAIGRMMLERHEALAALLHDEMGRSHVDSVRGEISSMPDFTKAAAKLARRELKPAKVPLNPINFPGKKAVTEALPRGVIGILSPWNYPILNLAKHLFPALLAGNAVVIKPSEFAPRVPAWIAAVAGEVLPEGLVGVVQGGPEVGDALVRGGIDALAFTGSSRTGRKIAATAGELLLPVTVELGGKDAAIVLADCELARTVTGVAHWAFHNGGQDCASIERVFVEEAIADEFVKRLAVLAPKITVADSSAPADIGPVQNGPQLDVIEAQVAQAIEAGASLVAGGKRTGKGLGYAPTVLDRCTPEMTVLTDETFGPVLPIVRIKDGDEGVRLANASAYGLCGSVWTKNLVEGERLARQLEVGVAWVNNHALAGVWPDVPWTGMKDTGTGVSNSRHAYAVYTRRRTLLVDKNKMPDPFWMPGDANTPAFFAAVVDMTLGKLSALPRLLGLLGKRQKAIRQAGEG